MLYRDQKLKQIISTEMKGLWKTAAASRERTCWFGGLAVLGWIACIPYLPPIQKAKSVIPHVIMIGVASGISKAIKDSLQKASDTQKRVVEMAKCLNHAETTDQLYQIHRKLGKLENQFILHAGRQKE